MKYANGKVPRSMIDRALDGFIPEPNTGCWLWRFKGDRSGYGKVAEGMRGSRIHMAHRVIYEHFKGPIPDGLFVDHVCRVKGCVNPDHLRVVTIAVNNVENSDSCCAIHLRKKNCPKCGSEYVREGRGRRCVPCRRKNAMRRWYARKEAVPIPGVA